MCVCMCVCLGGGGAEGGRDGGGEEAGDAQLKRHTFHKAPPLAATKNIARKMPLNSNKCCWYFGSVNVGAIDYWPG